MGADKTCVIDAGHPAIAGHFPSDPVVAGGRSVAMGRLVFRPKHR